MACIVCIPGAQEPLCSGCNFNPANDVPEEEVEIPVGMVGYMVDGEFFDEFDAAQSHAEQHAVEDFNCVIWTGSEWRTFNPDTDSFY